MPTTHSSDKGATADARGCIGFRATAGCGDPASALRAPDADADCGYVPGFYQSGFCACKDDIPRMVRCGAASMSCDTRCTRPPSPSTLSGVANADDANATVAAPPAPPPPTPPFYTHPLFLFLVAITLVVVVYLATSPVQRERAVLTHMIRRHERDRRVALVVPR